MVTNYLNIQGYKQIIKKKNISIAMLDVERDFHFKFIIQLLTIVSVDHPEDSTIFPSKIKIQQLCERITEGNLEKAVDFLKENREDEHVAKFLKEFENV